METCAERKRRLVWWRNCTTQPPRVGPLHPVAAPRIGVQYVGIYTNNRVVGMAGGSAPAAGGSAPWSTPCRVALGAAAA
eukprot:10257901-Lingulodinium_polyedra.AAC.1